MVIFETGSHVRKAKVLTTRSPNGRARARHKNGDITRLKERKKWEKEKEKEKEIMRGGEINTVKLK